MIAVKMIKSWKLNLYVDKMLKRRLINDYLKELI